MSTNSPPLIQQNTRNFRRILPSNVTALSNYMLDQQSNINRIQRLPPVAPKTYENETGTFFQNLKDANTLMTTTNFSEPEILSIFRGVGNTAIITCVHT